MNPDYSNARSADGTIVARWIYERIPLNTVALRRDPLGMAVASWKAPFGEAGDRLVAVEVLDRWLTPVGIHLSELPEDCWRWASPRCQRREVCEAVVSEWLDGTPARVLARRYGVNRDTVAGWLEGLQDLVRMDEQEDQQADGHGAPVPHPDRNPTANGRSGKAPGATHISSPAPGADLSEVAA